MANYLSVIQRAVDALDPNTVEARRELYDRARRMMRERLPRATAQAELAALDEAIELIEAETVRRSAAPPAIEPEPTEPPPAIPAEDIAEQSEEERARWRAVLLDAPKSKRWRIVIPAVLVLVLGAAAFFWLRPEAGLEPAAPDERPVVNYVYLRQPVYYRTTHPAGTIIIAKQQNFLYVVRPNVVAIRYGIGLGRECAAATGLHRVTGKEEWPGLRSSDDRTKNPLGARAINFGTGYRIHGTSAPAQVIGDDVDFGCFHLANADAMELYDKTPVDTRVVVEE
jgi:lipoprotein-anchoring transpeptidase ErfK/SrfK